MATNRVVFGLFLLQGALGLVCRGELSEPLSEEPLSTGVSGGGHQQLWWLLPNLVLLQRGTADGCQGTPALRQPKQLPHHLKRQNHLHGLHTSARLGTAFRGAFSCGARGTWSFCQPGRFHGTGAVHLGATRSAHSWRRLQLHKENQG